MQQITAQVGQPQGFVQVLLLGSELIEHQLHLNQAVAEMADAHRAEAQIIRADRRTGGSPGGNAQGCQQGQCSCRTRGRLPPVRTLYLLSGRSRRRV